jgi:L-ascorbate metabolism protein UlaG (beta-lactamase superfamily)
VRTPALRMRRLSWAGLELVGERVRILIDPLENVAPLESFLGPPREPILHIAETATTTHALVTHRHPDHFDPVTLARVLGRSGTVFCPRSMVEELRDAGLRAHGFEPWETKKLDMISVAAVAAVDWRGDDQVSWVVEHNRHRIIHCGDTIWHGRWWRIAREYGPFDWAFLPINGVIATYPGLEPSGLPATLTPKQACVAGRILQASKLCPIHYGTFNNPPVYIEQPNLLAALAQAAREEKVDVRMLNPGDALVWGDDDLQPHAA